jgi:hypothetical protein
MCIPNLIILKNIPFKYPIFYIAIFFQNFHRSNILFKYACVNSYVCKGIQPELKITLL